MSDAETISLVTCRVGNLTIGVEISQVREISRIASVTRVPTLPAAICGTMNLRGNLVTLLDLCQILNGAPSEDPSSGVSLIVYGEDEEILGLVADSLRDVMSCARDAIQPTPPHMEPGRSRFLSGVVELEQDILLVLDLQTVLDPAQLEGVPG